MRSARLSTATGAKRPRATSGYRGGREPEDRRARQLPGSSHRHGREPDMEGPTVKRVFMGPAPSWSGVIPEGADVGPDEAASTTNQADMRGLPGAEPHDRGSSGAASV